MDGDLPYPVGCERECDVIRATEVIALNLRYGVIGHRAFAYAARRVQYVPDTVDHRSERAATCDRHLDSGLDEISFIFIILHFATSELTFISMLHELPLLKEHE